MFQASGPKTMGNHRRNSLRRGHRHRPRSRPPHRQQHLFLRPPPTRTRLLSQRSRERRRSALCDDRETDAARRRFCGRRSDRGVVVRRRGQRSEHGCRWWFRHDYLGRCEEEGSRVDCERTRSFECYWRYVRWKRNYLRQRFVIFNLTQHKTQKLGHVLSKMHNKNWKKKKKIVLRDSVATTVGRIHLPIWSMRSDSSYCFIRGRCLDCGFEDYLSFLCQSILWQLVTPFLFSTVNLIFCVEWKAFK